MFGFNSEEARLFKKLNTPEKIQDFLNRLPFNFEKGGDTLMSPRRVLSEKKAHCFEGALFAATGLWAGGGRPLIMDLLTTNDDDYHVVALFKKYGSWGAISKTNHAVLRYREPIYKNLHELSLSYFHEYFLNKNGKKTLREYSRPLDLSLKRFSGWTVSADNLWPIDKALEETKHYRLLSPLQIKKLRPAEAIERRAGRIVEWKPKGR